MAVSNEQLAHEISLLASVLREIIEEFLSIELQLFIAHDHSLLAALNPETSRFLEVDHRIDSDFNVRLLQDNFCRITTPSLAAAHNFNSSTNQAELRLGNITYQQPWLHCLTLDEVIYFETPDRQLKKLTADEGVTEVPFQRLHRGTSCQFLRWSGKLAILELTPDVSRLSIIDSVEPRAFTFDGMETDKTIAVTINRNNLNLLVITGQGKHVMRSIDLVTFKVENQELPFTLPSGKVTMYLRKHFVWPSDWLLGSVDW